jgi:beta-glucosidase
MLNIFSINSESRILLMLCFYFSLYFPSFAQNELYLDSTASINDRVEDLLSRMTNEEKVGQMIQAERGQGTILSDITEYFLGSVLSGGGSVPYPNTPESWMNMYDNMQDAALATRLGTPIIYGIDAVHGHNNVQGSVIFPHNIGLGCTRDSILVEKVAKITAMEVSATGLNWTFAPCIAVARDERWGRTYESFGETPELAEIMGAASVRGLQGDSLAQASSIVACAKHYIADGGTTGGDDQGNAEFDEVTLRAIHLPGYIKAIENNVGTVMISYSSWNGVKCHGNYYLITTLLKEEFGFKGFVVSDWNAIDQLDGTYLDKVKTAVNAGIDMAMVPSDYVTFFETLLYLVQNGDVNIERINDAVRRILKIKFEMGLFENPYADHSLQDSLGTASHRVVGREAVRKSVVLLKKKDGILPLAKEDIKIMVAGVHANDLGYQCGGWTIYWQGGSGDITTGTTILKAMQQAAPAADIAYSENGTIIDSTADVAVVAIGETPYAEGYGDRDDLSLQKSSINLVKKLKDAGLQVIVILISGRPLIIEPIIPYSDAILAAWLPGTEGQGITDILFGDYNPSGKLSHSWPRKMQDIPINSGDIEYDPLFEYGFGILNLTDTPFGSAPEVYSAMITSPTELYLSFNKKMTEPANAKFDFHVKRNDTDDIVIDSIKINSADRTTLILYLANPVFENNTVTVSYSGESVFSDDGGQLAVFDPLEVYNSLDEFSAAVAIPGKIEAEDYYDMSGIQTENTSDVGGGLNVGYIDDADWMSYLIDVSVTSYYRITTRVASQSTGGLIHFKIEDNILSDVDVPITGDWQNWRDVITFIHLEKGTYELQLYAAKGGYNVNWINFEIINSINPVDNVHLSYALYQNYPNPFNPKTTINYDLPDYSHVILTVYNMLGQKVEELVNQTQRSGHYSVQFNGSKLPSGIYYYRLEVDKYIAVRKMLLLK